MTLDEEITDLLLYEKLARNVTKKKFPTFQDAVKALRQKYSCTCPHCKGKGVIDLGTYDYYDRTREYAPCYDCNGRGYVTSEEARKIQERLGRAF